MSAEVTPLHAVEDAKSEKSAHKPSTRELAEQIAAQEPYATGGAQTYTYVDGYYQPGERHLQQRIVELLGDGWSRRKADEITAFLRVTSPELWERPPLGTINVPNGLLDVHTRKLRAHTPEHLSPVRTAAAYDKDAECPAIEAFLETTIPELIPLFMEVVGYLIVPDNRLQRAFMLMGPGGTAKSTTANLIRHLLGRENVSAVALHQLEEDRFATADLYGRLANVFADLDARALKSSSMFKSITGGDAIRAERKNRDSFTFAPYARMVFSANEAPPTADSSDAFFDRWMILPFHRRHRGTDHQDHDLLAKLTTPTELSGLLNHALDGLDRLRQQHDFTRVDASEKAAERFRVDADSAAGFCEERCNIEDEARIAKPLLFQAYRAWCEANNRRPLAAVRFSRRLAELHHLDHVSSKGRDYWLGIDTREEP
jgi:putative DNA primase/helicase